MKEKERKYLQQAIIAHAAKGLPAVTEKAFERGPNYEWRPRANCLTARYSTSEAVICGILLCFYFNLYIDWQKRVDIPDKEYANFVTDLIWPGAYYFVQATERLYDKTSWESIRMLLNYDAEDK